jgi:hypothetical protein
VQREDYIMRMIEQLAAAIRKIAGLREKGEYARALGEAADAWEKLLEVPRELVERVDGPTLASLLRTPDKMRAAADLLIEEARVFAGNGDPLHATVCYRKAHELYLEARAIAPLPSDDNTLLELARHVPPGVIDPRYRR